MWPAQPADGKGATLSSAHPKVQALAAAKYSGVGFPPPESPLAWLTNYLPQKANIDIGRRALQEPAWTVRGRLPGGGSIDAWSPRTRSLDRKEPGVL